MLSPPPPVRRWVSLPAWFLVGLCACGSGADESAPAQAPPPVVDPELPAAPFDPARAPTEIAAYVLAPGETLGVIELADENGRPSLRRGVLRDGDGMVNHGRFERWHPNGQVAEDGWYFRGAKHGTYAVVAESGLKQTEQTFQHGVKQGAALHWGERGHLKERAHFVDGVLEGLFETFAGSGPRSRGSYRAGVEEGLWTWWLAEGGKEREGSFERGKRVGPWSFWRDNGSLKSQEEYVDGVLQGRVQEFDAEGRLSAERTYRAGVPDGLSIEYHPDGLERARSEYLAGVLHGAQARWYEGGVLQLQGRMDQGRRVGPWLYNQTDGSRNEAWSGTYEADVRVGD